MVSFFIGVLAPNQWRAKKKKHSFIGIFLVFRWCERAQQVTHIPTASRNVNNQHRKSSTHVGKCYWTNEPATLETMATKSKSHSMYTWKSALIYTLTSAVCQCVCENMLDSRFFETTPKHHFDLVIVCKCESLLIFFSSSQFQAIPFQSNPFSTIFALAPMDDDLDFKVLHFKIHGWSVVITPHHTPSDICSPMMFDDDNYGDRTPIIIAEAFCCCCFICIFN